ncbi:hypothetical protein [uncultured Hyphomicrobium sp.]|uniref:hypothetical protein n=1 Tax=uncultured Hyphomicrobium sp. TaxID=194373 RepID=UPI0025F93350|nr:hypothetical protein [uncultured Hyphomicrobium sp.]
MSNTLKLLLTVGLLLPHGSARAEPVYEFVRHCKEENLGHCFFRIQERLTYLNSNAARRVCLPPAFSSAMVHNASIPVSVLEHVRLGLSAARFGHAEEEANIVIAKVVATIYPCE